MRCQEQREEIRAVRQTQLLLSAAVTACRSLEGGIWLPRTGVTGHFGAGTFSYRSVNPSITPSGIASSKISSLEVSGSTSVENMARSTVVVPLPGGQSSNGTPKEPHGLKSDSKQQMHRSRVLHNAAIAEYADGMLGSSRDSWGGRGGKIEGDTSTLHPEGNLRDIPQQVYNTADALLTHHSRPRPQREEIDGPCSFWSTVPNATLIMTPPASTDQHYQTTGIPISKKDAKTGAFANLCNAVAKLGR